MENGNRTHDRGGNRRRPLLGVALVLVCALSSAVTSPASAAWGKKKKGKKSAAAPSAKKISAVAEKMLQKARVLREKGKNEQAIEMYKQSLQIDPTLAEAYLELADIYIDINIPERAAEMLETGLPLAEQLGYEPAALAESWCQAAELHVQLGSIDLASGDLVRATALAPEDARPHKIAGDIHAARERFDDAFGAYGEAVRLDPGFGDAWHAMGTLALETKRAKEAQAAYNGLLNADTGRAEQFADQMRQVRLKPVVMPAAKEQAVAAPSDDPYAVPGDASAPAPRKIEKPAGPKPKPKPEAKAPADDPYAGIETAAKPPASVSVPASAAEESPLSLPPDETKAGAGAPASEATPLSDSLLQAMTDRLFDEDPALVAKAVEELALYPEQSFPVIVERLADPDPERRIRLTRALGGMKAITDTVMPVLEGLLLDPDPGVQAAAEEAIDALAK